MDRPDAKTPVERTFSLGAVAWRAWLTCVVISLVALLAPACQDYVAPPAGAIDGLHDGVLDDPSLPLVVRFTKPVDPATLRVKVIAFEPDATGKLADELGDDTVDLHPFFSHDPTDGDHGGAGVLDDTAQAFTITLDARLPVGPKLAVLLEPGLADTTGETTQVRKRLVFSYDFKCSGGAGTKVFSSGAYFLVINVEVPIGTQIKLFGLLDVDPSTGLFRGQFTDASRIKDPNRCAPPCTAGDVCRTLPGPAACVVPSTRADGADEFPDFSPTVTPPIGFSFTVTGCAEDQPGGDVAFATAPANMVVQQPPVSVNGLVVVASFAPDASFVLRGRGGITGDDIVFGTSSLGAGRGTLAARFIPADQAPMGIPSPP